MDYGLDAQVDAAAPNRDEALAATKIQVRVKPRTMLSACQGVDEEGVTCACKPASSLGRGKKMKPLI